MQQEKFNIVGLLDHFRNVGEHVLGYPILGEEEDLKKISKKIYSPAITTELQMAY